MEPRRDTRKGHGIELGETFMFHGTGRSAGKGVLAHLEVAATGAYMIVADGMDGRGEVVHPASKFWAAPVGERRIIAIPAPYVNVRTSTTVPVHLSTINGLGDGIGRLLCGKLASGTIGPFNVNGVDCVGCVDAYTAILAGREPDTTSTSHLQRDMSIHA
jgi:hypothetical protein